MKQEQQYARELQPAGAETEQLRSTRPGAMRMTRLRDRRRRGFRVSHLECCNADLDALIAGGFLDHLDRNNPNAVERAIGAVLDQLSG
jgi:hypothetical protein